MESVNENPLKCSHIKNVLLAKIVSNMLGHKMYNMAIYENIVDFIDRLAF